MPRSKLGIKREKIKKEDVETAIKFVVEKRMSIGEASRHFNLKKSTLIYHLKNHKLSGKPDSPYTYSPKKPKKVFTHEEELVLADYLVTAANMHYGLTKDQVLRLAYDFAVANNKHVDNSWHVNRKAGKQWLRDFRRKFHEKLTLQKPQATSLSRATAFNKETVAVVFNNYKKVLERHSFQPSQIWNCDETGITTVHVPPKVLAPKGKKQVGGMTSGERGALVTMICAISASGNSIPPLFVFPRVNYKPFMLNGAPVGSIGAANSFGWSNETTFLQFSKHFIDHVRPNAQNPALLLMDNHDTHVSIPVIDLAKENNVTILTFHPHTSHKMQPLDRGVFGPFKTFYNQAMNNFMLTPGNAGKPVTIYDLANLAGIAFRQAFTQNNIIKGFKVSGFVPLNENIFSEEEFLPSAVTDRPIAHEPTVEQETGVLPNDSEMRVVSPSTSSFVPPNVVRPFPKAAERKIQQNRGRPRGKSRIITDTPEKLAIEATKKRSEEKQRIKNNKISNQKKTVKKTLFTEEESSDSEVSISSGESDLNISEESDEEHGEKCGLKTDKLILEPGDFVIINVTTKKSSRFFIGKTLFVEDDGLKVQFLKKVPGTSRFIMEDVNIYDVDKNDVKAKLPIPKLAGASARLKDSLVFSLDFGSFKVE